EARSRLADYLDSYRNNLAFISNATTGGNIVARSLNLGSGDEVLSTGHEYGALDRTWWFLAEKHNFKYINYKLPSPLTSPKHVADALWINLKHKNNLPESYHQPYWRHPAGCRCLCESASGRNPDPR
ncbi:MAG: hypothetical protein WCF08_08640, partial [Anaerolineaceae bacterium]